MCPAVPEEPPDGTDHESTVQSMVDLASVPDPQHHDVAADCRVDHPVLSYSELEETFEFARQGLSRDRVATEDRPYLAENSLHIFGTDILEVATDGRFVEDPTGQA